MSGNYEPLTDYKLAQCLDAMRRQEIKRAFKAKKNPGRQRWHEQCARALEAARDLVAARGGGEPLREYKRTRLGGQPPAFTINGRRIGNVGRGRTRNNHGTDSTVSSRSA